MSLTQFFHLLERRPASPKKQLSPDERLIQRFLSLPTEWELSLRPHTPCIRLFGRESLESLQDLFKSLVEGHHTLTADERCRMKKLLDIDRKVRSHLDSSPGNEGLLIIDWLSRTIDEVSGESLLTLLAKDDIKDFCRGHQAVLRALR